MKKAIIELQTNRVSLILLDTKNNVNYNVMDVFTDSLAIGKEIDSEGILKPIMAKELLRVLKMYRRICDRNAITDVLRSRLVFYKRKIVKV